MRAKSARAQRTNNVKSPIINKIEEPNKNYEQNPFLKLLTISKKEKQMSRARSFNDRIVNTSLNISKSALRRRKRKARESLKPKMDDLLASLPGDDSESNHNDSSSQNNGSKEYIEATVKAQNKPNVKKKSGQQIIFKQEHQHFNEVLQNNQFRSSPFATLRSAISQNMEK